MEVEREYRVSISRDFYDFLLNTRGITGPQRSISLIEKDGRIKCITIVEKDGELVNGEKKHYKKVRTDKKTVTRFNGIDVRLVTSEETPIAEFNNTSAAFVRVKERWTFTRGNLQYDITRSAGMSQRPGVRADAIKFLQGNEGIYELEVELLNGSQAGFQQVMRPYNYFVLQRIAALVGHPNDQPKSIRSLVMQAAEICRKDLPEITGWLASLKFDGLHCLVYIANGYGTILTSQHFTTFQTMAEDSPTILEGELIGEHPRIFDVWMRNGRDLSLESQEYRMSQLPPNFMAVKHSIINGDITTALKLSTQSIDGLMLTNGFKRYKWKPRITMDFYIGPNFELCCSIRKKNVTTQRVVAEYGDDCAVVFEPISNTAINIISNTINIISNTINNSIGNTIESGKVGEFYWDNGWQFMRYRTDRAREKNYFGNFLGTAQANFEAIMNPVSIEDIAAVINRTS